ncbi:MAG: hypothetical protein DRH15_15295, partial [Deltaproteobacteria bacterium]
MKHLAEIKSYLQAKGLSKLLPMIGGNPRTLTTVIEKLKDHAIEVTLKTVEGGEYMKRKRREGINNLFE